MSAELGAGAVLRITRAAVLACVIAGVSTIAHMLGGGQPPGPLTLSALTVACTAGLSMFLRRPASTRRIVSLLCGGQLLMHSALTVLAGHSSVPMAGMDAVSMHPIMPGMSMTAEPGFASAPHPVQHLTGEMLATRPAMIVAHLAAAAVLGIWLSVGERMVWRTVVLMARPVARAAVHVVRALLAVVRMGLSSEDDAPHQPCRPPRWPDRALLNRVSPPTAIVRRGPPVAKVPITTVAF
ncbi:hypothetical protein [Actinoplanes sp. ATCC 53533]|uniref:hypothetical protein n=1 Tax=Actinoplanes sp. ATCC 53533 TaxID=1288362 RepID=UPI000F7A29CD|nr:hypothetical protein [Actinoplanes sp. ATCC 53533]